MTGSAGQAGLLPDLLAHASAALEPLGESAEADREILRALTERLSRGRFHLAVLGQFKRGKSSLVNALLGVPLLPTAVVPLTALPTLVAASDRLTVRIHFDDDRPPETSYPTDIDAAWQTLARYVTETGNPTNRRGVNRVEVEGPFALLRQGVVLIDTPGIGSTLSHNTAMTMGFLHQCDAALFVLSVDPPITATEIDFLREVREQVAGLLFVLNKVDYLNDHDRREALDYLAGVLHQELGLTSARIFAVSARQALEAAHDGLREASGLADLERHLIDYLAREKARTLAVAIARKAAEALGRVAAQVRLTRRALELPLHDLTHRLTLFETKLAEVEAERVRLQDSLVGDGKRLHRLLEELADALRQAARDHLRQVVTASLAAGPVGGLAEEAVAERLKEAIPEFFGQRRDDTVKRLRERLAAVVEPHERRADELVDAVRRTAAEIFEVPHQTAETGETFELLEQPYWVREHWSAKLAPLAQSVAERLLPGAVRRQRLQARLDEQVEALVVRNVENLRWSVYQSLDQTLHRLSTTLNQRLAETLRTTHGAIQAALRQRHERAASVEAARGPLLEAEQALAILRAQLLTVGEVADERSPESESLLALSTESG